MPEYGLTLPDNDLTAAEFKELARRIGRAAFVPLFLKFYERVISTEASVEEQRKALADIGRWTGVEEDRKTDPNANLPVFNIVFGAAGTNTASIEAVEVFALDTPPATDDQLPVLDLAAESASARGLMPRFLESQDVQGQPPARVEEDAPAVTRRRRARKSPDHEPQALRDTLPATGEASPVQDGAPAQPDRAQMAQAIVHEPPRTTDPFAESLASLDEALGL